MVNYRGNTDKLVADVAKLVDVYDAMGFDAASARCAEIAKAHGLDAGGLLTLADAFRRRVILG